MAVVCTIRGGYSATAIVFRALLTIRGQENRSGTRINLPTVWLTASDGRVAGVSGTTNRATSTSAENART